MTQTLTRRVHVEHVMGTVITFDVRREEPPEGAVEDAVAWLHAIEAEFSTYLPDSAVCRFDRGELLGPDLSERMRWVIDTCAALKRQTGGFFDAYATGRFDPSALVKGWAVQRAADGLRAAGAENFCVTAGGDVFAYGQAEPDEPWRVGIRHPHDPHALAAVVEVGAELAVATSGLYERGGHIIDPVSGRPPDGVLSVTVVGPDLGGADAYATAAFAMGADGPEWSLGLDGYESLTILENETVLTTPGFPLVAA